MLCFLFINFQIFTFSLPQLLKIIKNVSVSMFGYVSSQLMALSRNHGSFILKESEKMVSF